MREKTRNQRYLEKQKQARKLPVSLVAINFHCDENLAFLIRTAACFGATEICVIGSIPSRKELKNPSGSLVDFVKIRQFSTPSYFLRYVRNNNINLVSAEISEGAVSLYDHHFGFNQHTAIVLGNETSGIPVEIINNSKVIYIPMIGTGFCLNTSQTGTAIMTEYVRQFLVAEKKYSVIEMYDEE